MGNLIHSYKKAGPVIAAVSGGADSLCLLVLMHEAGLKVTALHCNHGLRGAASDADEAFVRKFCAERGIACLVYRKKLGKGAGIEERARDWRRRCYALAATKLGARYVFLAQHARDQAETLILNLARGAGLKGARGMQLEAALPGSKAKLVRPFLEMDPAQLRAELKRRGLRWREDASNRDPRFARNAVRLKVLPKLEKLMPGATLRLAQFTRRLDGRGIEGLDSRGMGRVRELLKRGQGTVDLKGGMALQASAGMLRLKALPRLKVEVRPVGAKWRPEANAFWFSDVDLANTLKVRGARPGDRFRPFGMKGSRLVFDLLAEVKVPAWNRTGWPLLLGKAGVILGVLGLRQAEGYRVKAGKGKGLRVTWPSFDKAQGLC